MIYLEKFTDAQTKSQVFYIYLFIYSRVFPLNIFNSCNYFFKLIKWKTECMDIQFFISVFDSKEGIIPRPIQDV